MKTFDYETSRIKDFWFILGNTVGVWQQLILCDSPQVYHFDLRAAVGYVAIMTADDNGHLEPRDLIKIVGRGAIKIKTPPRAKVTITYWSDVDLASWHRNERHRWHTIHGAKRKR